MLYKSHLEEIKNPQQQDTLHVLFSKALQCSVYQVVIHLIIGLVTYWTLIFFFMERQHKLNYCSVAILPVGFLWIQLLRWTWKYSSWQLGFLNLHASSNRTNIAVAPNIENQKEKQKWYHLCGININYFCYPDIEVQERTTWKIKLYQCSPQQCSPQSGGPWLWSLIDGVGSGWSHWAPLLNPPLLWSFSNPSTCSLFFSIWIVTGYQALLSSMSR